MKKILLLIITLLSTVFVTNAQQSADTTTSTVWQCTIQWQGQPNGTPFYLVMKNNNTAQLVTFENNRVIKESASWEIQNNQLTILLSNESVVLQSSVSNTQYTGACSNLASNATGTWNGTIMPNLTESALKQMVMNAATKKNK